MAGRIYAFWTFLLRLLPHVADRAYRWLLFGAMLAATASVLVLDYAEMQAAPAESMLSPSDPFSPAIAPLPPSPASG